MNRKRVLLFSTIFFGLLSFCFGQTYCPPNIDFESGTLSTWTFFRGRVATGPVYTFTSTAPVPTMHALTSGASIDYFGGFPIVAPDGGSFSCKLGRDSNNNAAQRARYYIRIPSGPSSYSLIYKYAVVLENPGTTHSSAEQPRMTIVATDSLTGTAVPCATFNYISSGTLPGFSNSPVMSTIIGNGYDVRYKPWTTGNLKFFGYGGRTVAIDITVNGCTLGGHFGYGYFDMSCGLFAISTLTCGSSTATLSAPDGYSGYRWTDSATYSATYATTQVATITVPTVATTYAVILTPYTGYGCPDTLFTRLVPTDLRTAPSNDTTICRGASVTLTQGATDISLPLTYSWSPSTGLSCTTCETPVASPTLTTTYYPTVVDAGGCRRTDTIVVTVLPFPLPISGTRSVCLGSTTTLTDGTPGGWWSTAGTGVVTIGSSTGVVTGVAVGTEIITYATGGICPISTTVTVNPLPPAITGTRTVCAGSTTILSNPSPGGTWSSGALTIATVGSATGIVTGISAGTAVITYTYTTTGCRATAIVTVTPLPSMILGLTSICSGATTTMIDGTPGGTWSSSNPGVAFIAPSSGILAGVSAGTAVISYTLPTSCFVTTTITINPVPLPITGTTRACELFSTTLADATTGGAWSSSDYSIASIDPITGVVTGYLAGTAVITYTLPTSGCYAITTYTVHPTPSPITGVTSICLGNTSTLTNTGGGTWISSNVLVAPIGSTSGIVSGLALGTSSITYRLPTGCIISTPVVVNPNPGTITGPARICVGSTGGFSCPGGGTWSSSDPSVAPIVSILGLATGISAGTTIITYHLSTGCYSTTTLTVIAPPGAITGSPSVCVGGTTTLSDPTPGGTWISSRVIVATVGSTTGIVTGVAAGTSIITYSLLTNCNATRIVTVTPAPAPISGVSAICVGSSTLFTDATTGGVWSSSASPIASVSSVGLVTGVSAGTAIITYATGPSCFVTKSITINPIPTAISGSTNICFGQTTTLGNTVSGGVWTSSNTLIATAGSSSGIITGVALGTSVITYSLGAGCMVTTVVTVTTMPSAIGGGSNVCLGYIATLTNTVSGGTWSSSNMPVATIGSLSGVITGVSIGTTVITYRLPTGCLVTTTISVNPAPGPVSGPGSVCTGFTITLLNSVSGGSWSSSNALVASVGSVSGIVTGVAAGTAVITYSMGLGCIATAVVAVYTSPTAISGPSAVCVGSTMTLTNGVSGGTWISSNIAVATIGLSSGIVTGVSLGTATITYTVTGGCLVTKTITVSPTPGPVLGTPNPCVGGYTTYTNIVPGGLWTSSGTSITIGSTSGVVYGVSAGVATITYSLGSGCTSFRTVTVIPGPAPIVGSSSVCVGSTTLYTDATTGGTWSSSDAMIAAVSSGGIVSGVAVGTATITYTATTGCFSTKSITVFPTPAAITGITSMCVGATTTLSDPTPSGVWSSSSSLIASVGSATGVVLGVSSGTAVITYTLGASCIATTVVTVLPTPSPIGGVPVTGIGSTTTLTNLVSGGTWSSSDVAIASVGLTTGIVLGNALGTATITYTIGSCFTTRVVTVIFGPTPIIGPRSLCTSLCNLLTDGVSGGVWSSSNPAVATIGSISGLVCGIVPGTSNITYSLGFGLISTATVTVYPSPAAITGISSICAGATTTLADVTPGGSWSSGDIAIGTVGSTTGVVTGISAGTVTITYALATCFSIKVVTVNPTPGPITGPTTVCNGSTITLSNIVSGGTWSTSSFAIATVGVSSGIVTGVSTGTARITYNLGAGCLTTTTITVNPILPITGSNHLCVGSTTLLADAVPGGTWSSSDDLISTIGSVSGLVTGITAGTAYITYTLPTGCTDTLLMNIHPIPDVITGPSSVCVASTINLSNLTPGGNWSTTSSLITISPTTGLVTGISAGVAPVTYTIAFGCRVSTNITVYPLPLSITGAASGCVGSTFTVSSLTPGGTWTSSSTGIADVGLTTGIVTGVAAGFATLTYMLPTGCYTTRAITINPVPNPITGAAAICVGQTIGLFESTIGGSWVSSNPLIATVGSASGTVLGISAGSILISYVLPTGCVATHNLSVAPLPAPITGPRNVCVGSSITLNDITPGGIWTSANPAVGSIGITTGILTGVTSGTVLISYSPGSACPALTTIIVNPISPINGPSVVCERQTIVLTDTSEGGVWTSSNPAIARVISTIDTFCSIRGIAPGVATITYSLPTGCVAYKTIRVLMSPPPITGPSQVCVGQTITLGNPIFGGTWSVDSTSIATVGISTGVVTGVSAGIAIVSYTLGGCPSTRAITVNPLPATITGSPNICVGRSSTLSSSTTGGTWTSSRPATATIDAGTGLVTGITSGIATITYRVATGCYTTMAINVDPSPAAITGSHNVCIGLSTPLANVTSGGGWTSSNTLTAPVDAMGVVYGVALGTATITYTVSTGCFVTFDVTVNNLPAPITGPSDVCVGQSITLFDVTPGGSWLSGDVAIATAGSMSGVVTGISAGVVPITYTLGTGCTTSTNILVNPLPSPIVGGTQVCEGATLALYSAPGGGGWGSSNTTVATVDAGTGVVTGVAAGTATITYAAGCYTTITITVNRMPAAITGNPVICLGSTNILGNSVPGGTWTSLVPAVAPVTTFTGRVTGAALGASTITYSLGAGCEVTQTVAVVPLPVVYTVSGTGSFCAGGTGIHLYLSGSQVGVNYLLYIGSTATGTFAGTGSGLDFGLQTVGGTYHVVAISASSGCSATMAGTATITVNPTVTPRVNITATGGSDTICAGASTIYTAIPTNGGSAPAYVWTVNGTTVGTGGTYSFIPADGDIIRVVLTSNALCAIPDTGSISKRITVSANQNPVMNILSSPGDTVCKGMAIHLTASPVWGGYTPSIIWRKFGLNVSAGPTYSYIPDDGDVITVFMTSSYPCLSVDTVTSPALQVRTVEPKLPEVLITAAPDYQVGTGRMVTLTAVVTNGGLYPTYQWLINGVPIAGATNVTYSSNTFHSTFQDSVTCAVTSSGVCPTVGYGWAYINVNDVSVITLSGNGSISVLPNPSKGVFTVKGSIGAAESATIEVTDMLGRVVYSKTATARNGELNAQVQLSSELSNGMYLLNLHTEQNNKVFHIVLER